MLRILFSAVILLSMDVLTLWILFLQKQNVNNGDIDIDTTVNVLYGDALCTDSGKGLLAFLENVFPYLLKIFL